MSALPSIPNEHNLLTAVDRDIETWNMQRLAKVQATPGVNINEFITDGCSGGLSFAWKQLSNTIPAFAQKFGNKPPWESCCIDHDRAYWQGQTDNGYQKRLDADLKLRQCVIEYVHDNQQQLSQQTGISPQIMTREVDIVAGLMFQAVRLGGKPCSYLSWRWGYGWPDCPVLPKDAAPLAPSAN